MSVGIRATVPTPDFLWLDVKDDATITRDASNNVQVWRDKSLRGFNASIGGGAPLWVASSTPNSSPAIRFEGAASLQTSAMQSSPQMTIFVVYRLNAPQTWGAIVNQAHDTYFSIRRTELGPAAGSLNFHIRNNNDVPTLPITLGAWQLLTAVQGASTTTMYYNPSSPASTTQAPIDSGSAPITIGNSILGGQSMGGLVAEIMAYASALSLGERAQIEAILRTKYGL
jgi:hypothetical protein